MTKLDKATALKQVSEKYSSISFCLNEMGRRLWAASESKALGYGGTAIVIIATGMSSATINKGLKELANQSGIDKTRIRKSGGGRKSLKDTNVVSALDKLVEPTSRGNPESPLRWTSKSVRNLESELLSQGYKISFRSVSGLLKSLGYSLQANKKMDEGKSHQDRDGQFKHINEAVSKAIELGHPVISVDAKKKENIGNFKNNGKEYNLKKTPTRVNTYDFPDKKLGKVAPYGVYDVGQNSGWVSVGISSDTAEFAVNSIRSWWYKLGQESYKNTTKLVITADCGGSNGYKVRLWKYELQKFADETNLTIKVHHLPPGTSKWNKIEHRLFSYISKNWRGVPLITREVVVNLIGNTKTNTGLKVMSLLDKNSYKTGIKINDNIFSTINIKGDSFHPEWNYEISPRVV